MDKKKRNKPELKQQSLYIIWAKEHGLMPYGIPASTWTTSWDAINDNKRAGVTRGLPDTITLIPANRSILKKNMIVFIEFKRADGKGRLSKEQKQFIDFVQDVGGDIYAQVCNGYNEAVDFVQHLVKGIPDAEQDKWLKDNKLI